MCCVSQLRRRPRPNRQYGRLQRRDGKRPIRPGERSGGQRPLGRRRNFHGQSRCQSIRQGIGHYRLGGDDRDKNEHAEVAQARDEDCEKHFGQIKKETHSGQQRIALGQSFQIGGKVSRLRRSGLATPSERSFHRRSPLARRSLGEGGEHDRKKLKPRSGSLPSPVHPPTQPPIPVALAPTLHNTLSPPGL